MFSPLGRSQCTKCFWFWHSREGCAARIRCASCFHLAHVAISCHFPRRFLRLSKNPTFYNQINLNGWDEMAVKLWFRSSVKLPGGPGFNGTHQSLSLGKSWGRILSHLCLLGKLLPCPPSRPSIFHCQYTAGAGASFSVSPPPPAPGVAR